MSGSGGPIGWKNDDAVLWNRGRTLASNDDGVVVTVPVGKGTKVITIDGQTGAVSSADGPARE